jgi:type III secretory pathway component EscU
MCWEKDENGKVIGMCSTEELKRRIHDPNYMPELKEPRREMTSNRKPLSEEAKARAQQGWLEFLNR